MSASRHASRSASRRASRLPGVAAAAPTGPVWVGDTALVSDGSVYLTGAVVDMTAPISVVARYVVTSPSATHRAWGIVNGTVAGGDDYYAEALTTTAINVVAKGSGTSGVKGLTGGAGSHLIGAKFTGATTRSTNGSRNGAVFASGTFSGVMANANGGLYVMAIDGGFICSSGLSLYEIAIYAGAALSDADIAAIYNSGTPADWRTLIATQPTYYLDMANNQSDGGGGWQVLDLMGGTAATVNGGGSGNFA